ARAYSFLRIHFFLSARLHCMVNLGEVRRSHHSAAGRFPTEPTGLPWRICCNGPINADLVSHSRGFRDGGVWARAQHSGTKRLKPTLPGSICLLYYWNKGTKGHLAGGVAYARPVH